MRKIFLTIACLLLAITVVPLGVGAEIIYTAGTAPVYEESGNWQYKAFYANGTEITIADRSDGVEGATISWDGGSQNIGKDTHIFGGGSEGTSYESSKITMTGGVVQAIYAGGRGTKTAAANVKTTNLTISGGIVTGGVFGGGYLTSYVKTSNVKVTGGKVASTMGGGAASGYTGDGSVGTKANPENSTCIVENANTTITGGTIIKSTVGYGLVYGGGQGYSYTKNANISIGGTADLSEAWLISGGSNGRTDHGVINITGGTIKVLQSINRGSMIDARVNITGGTIATAYLGGEDPEAFDDDIVNGGFLGNIIYNITGGTVTNINLGSNYDDAIKKDADYATLFYEKASVGNSADLKNTFGKIAIEYIDESIIADTGEVDKDIGSNLFEAIKETGNVYSYTIEGKYGWIFDGSTITDSSITVNTGITLTEKAPEALREGLEKQIKELSLGNVSFLNFAHSGFLPGPAIIVYNVADLYNDGTVLYVYHYNEETLKLEEPQKVVVEDGTIMFEITKCSSYALTTTEIVNPDTGDVNMYLIISAIIVGMALFGLATRKIIKNN